MSALLRLTIILVFAQSNIVNFGIFTRAMSTVTKAFEAHGVVPDVIKVAPSGTLQVKYPSGAVVNEGNELTPTQVKDAPQVAWEASPEAFYTLCMTDPDAQSGEGQHWLVGNIQGSAVESGETLSAYVGAGPPPDTGLHRYVFLVYQQPQGRIKFDEPRLNSTSYVGRGYWSIAKFAEKYNFGAPAFGNFFGAQYDDYVPVLYKQLGA